jgi:uncharacterized protein YjbI with pentapeptide repeats
VTDRRAVVAPRLPPVLVEVDVDASTDDVEWMRTRLRGDLSNRGFTDLALEESSLEGLLLTGARLNGARLTDVSITGCELSGVMLDGARLARVEFRDCRLSGIVLATARLRDVAFVNCRLDEANLRFLLGERVRFENCAMQRADLQGARLVDAALLSCDLTAVEFSRSDLAGTHFAGSILDGITGPLDLRGIIIDASQVLPLALPLIGALGIRIDDVG